MSFRRYGGGWYQGGGKGADKKLATVGVCIFVLFCLLSLITGAPEIILAGGFIMLLLCVSAMVVAHYLPNHFTKRRFKLHLQTFQESLRKENLTAASNALDLVERYGDVSESRVKLTELQKIKG